MRYSRFYQSKDINLLLMVLLLFCCGVAFLYGQEPQLTAPEIQHQNVSVSDLLKSHPANPLEGKTPEQIADYAAFLVETKSAKDVAALLRNMPPDKLIKALEYIFTDKKLQASQDFKLELLLALLNEYVHAHDKLLNLLEHGSLIHFDKPILLIAAEKGYTDKIPLILKWLNNLKKNANATKLPGRVLMMLELMPYNALSKAIEYNDIQALKTLFAQGVTVTHEQLNQLLWQVVKTKRSPAFVQILLDHDADINAVHEDHTALTMAVSQRNLPMIQAIVEGKAAHDNPLDINAMPSPQVGTALQLAIELRYPEVDVYLREHGAKEDGQFLKTLH